MIRKYTFLLFLFCYFTNSAGAQHTASEFFGEANGTIGRRDKVNAIGFRTQNVTAPFFAALKKRFGNPRQGERFLIYSGYNKYWSKNKVIIRIGPSIDTGLDGSKTNTLFIFVETKNKNDLLKPNTASYKKIKKYFLSLFNKTIKNGKPDSFDQ